MENRFLEKRRSPRVEVAGKVGSSIRAVIEASLLNLSTTGALVEHSHVLHLGSIYTLTIYTEKKELAMKCRVVRSFVSHSSKTEKGERALIYKSGLDFVDPRKEDLERIADIVRSLESGSEVSPVGLGVELELWG